MAIKLFSSLQHNSRKETALSTEDVRSVSSELGFEKWLPAAAEYHEISKSIKDYFFVPVVAIFSDLPNRNGVAMPASELLKWNRTINMPAYRGWCGCPVFKDHDWGDENTRRKPISYGLIADVAIRPLKINPSILKVIHLLAIDRSKDPNVTRDIEEGKVNSYSMGCTVEGYTCSECDAMLGECHHLNPKATMDFYQRGNKLIYRKCFGINPYEISIVSDPAYSSAIGEVVFKY